jgi:hypothetical protein
MLASAGVWRHMALGGVAVVEYEQRARRGRGRTPSCLWKIYACRPFPLSAISSMLLAVLARVSSGLDV